MNSQARRGYLLAALLWGSASFGAISVVVDGRPVGFPDAQPTSVNNRTLVPMRAIMESIGATVTWNARAQAVRAVRGNHVVQLRIGSSQARIDGRQVPLDVPAMVIGGSTMVPLRFIGEALGADVRWQESTQTVLISMPPDNGPPINQPPVQQPPVQQPPTDNRGLPLPTTGPVPTGGVPTIQSFTHNSNGWLAAGAQLQVTMAGTPGGQAQFELANLTDWLPMTEQTPGNYVGQWTVPANQPVSLSTTPVLGRLSLGGQPMLIQAGTPIAIDTVPPVIASVLPADNSRVSARRPTVSIVYSDGAGSGVDPASVRFTINGAEQTNLANVTPDQLLFRPREDLQPGVNNLAVSVRDRAGNLASRTWTVNVVTAASVIRSLTHNANRRLEPGDVFHVRLEAEQGGQARFSVGNVIDRPMMETAPGVYEADYTVRKTDTFGNGVLTATFMGRGGETYTMDAPLPVGIPGNSLPTSTVPIPSNGPVALAKPIITMPLTNSRVPSPFVVQGTADPGATVYVKAERKESIIGLINYSTTIYEAQVQADDLGRWTTAPINTGARGARIAVSAWTVGPNNQRSDATSIAIAGP